MKQRIAWRSHPQDELHVIAYVNAPCQEPLCVFDRAGRELHVLSRMFR